MMLYKYMPPSRLPVLLDRLIRFTPPGRLNDPFDMRPVVVGYDSPEAVTRDLHGLRPTILKQAYESLPAAVRAEVPFDQFCEHSAHLWPDLSGAAKQFADRECIGMWNVALRALDAAIGVMCLAEPIDSILMWSHYAQGHTGLALGFDSDHPFFHQSLADTPSEWGRLWPVNYSDDRPVVNLMDLRDFRILLTKSAAWTYEREHRIFLPLSLADQVHFDGTQLIHRFLIPADAITEVVLGSRFAFPDVDAIRAILLSNPAYKHVRLLRARPDERRFGIDVVPDEI